MKKIKISSTDFQNIVNSVGRDKINQIDKIQVRDPYEPYMDYYKAPRDCMEGICKDDLMAMVIDMKYLETNYPKLFGNLKKEQHFKQIREGLVRFCRKNSGGFFFTPQSSQWDFRNLQINVRPEIGFLLDGKRYFIKTYFGADAMVRSSAEMMCTLLANGFPEIGKDDNTFYGVLDVRRNKLFTYGQPTEEMKMLLNAEADLLIKLWERFKSAAA